MSRTRIRILLAAALVLTNLLILAGPLHAQSNTVSGSLVLQARIALSPQAVAIVTLADRSPSGGGTIIGQQRIDGATGNDAFSVPFDPANINQKHAYSVYASVIDSGKEYQSLLPVPTITGGPTSGLQVPIALPAPAQSAQVTGTIAMQQKIALSPTAVAYAVIVNETTGRLAARQVIPSFTSVPVSFTVTYDAALVNPDDTYGAVGAIIDGNTLYQSGTPVAIAAGAAVDLTVAKTNVVIPSPGAPATPVASGSPVATGTPGGSVAPSQQPSNTPKPTKTPNPTASEEPTATPTEAPTATPTPSPTASPTPAPSASPTAVASASAQPSASAAPSASPTAITVTGQVTYREPATLSAGAVLTITVVQVDPNGPTVVDVGKQRIDNPGQQPIAFSVPLDPALLVPTSDATLFATLVDGTNAWTTAGGVKVATNGAPTTDVQVPLTFRPDMIEGQVTGAVTGLPSDISLSAWGEAVILNQTDGTILGLQTGAIHGSTLVPFEVPFLVANVDPTKTYVIVAAVFDNTRTFRSESGVQVITNGTFSGVVLPMIAVNPSPTPTIAASPTAAPPTAAPATATAAHSTAPVATASPTTPSNTTGGGVDPLLIAGLLGLIVVGVIVVVVVVRR